jgi:hypothetical protein
MQTPGPLETEIIKILDDSIDQTPLSQGGTWGHLSSSGGVAQLTENDEAVLTINRLNGLKTAVLRIARELDGQ